jgi:hypothetical protein
MGSESLVCGEGCVMEEKGMDLFIYFIIEF